MAVATPGSPPRDLPHLETFPFLAPDELRAGEHVHKLVAEVIRRPRRVR